MARRSSAGYAVASSTSTCSVVAHAVRCYGANLGQPLFRPKLLIRMTPTPRPVLAAGSTLKAWSQTCLLCAMGTERPPGAFWCATSKATGLSRRLRSPRFTSATVKCGRCGPALSGWQAPTSNDLHGRIQRDGAVQGWATVTWDPVRGPSPGRAADSARARAGAPSSLDGTAVPTASGRLAGCDQRRR